MLPVRDVVVYSRKGCHLCEIVKETLKKLERRGGFTWREIDIDSNDELRRQFTDEVPVVFIDGHKAFKYRMDGDEFLRKLSTNRSDKINCHASQPALCRSKRPLSARRYP